MFNIFPETPLHELALDEGAHRLARKNSKRLRAEGVSFRFMREDVLNGKWTLFNSGVSFGDDKPMQVKRPKGYSGDLMPPVSSGPSSLQGCPFCAGDVTSELDSVSTSIPMAGDVLRFEVQEGRFVLVQDWSLAGRNRIPWQVRVVRNMYPELCVPREYYCADGCEHGFQDDHGEEINPHTENPWYRQVTAVGYNEVVIESPKHNSCMALEDEATIVLLIRAMLIRGKALRLRKEVKYITFFKQHKCGSMLHSHSQIITTPVVPSIIGNIAMRAHFFHNRYNKCCVCSVLVDGPVGDTMASDRLVLKSEHFIVSVPFAARERHRMMIAPRRHQKDFLDMNDAEAADLALVLKRTTSLYYHFLDDAPYQLACFTCPVRFDSNEELVYSHAFHWYLALYPRLKTRVRGLQSATDIAENDFLPEDNAAQLREWLSELYP